MERGGNEGLRRRWEKDRTGVMLFWVLGFFKTNLCIEVFIDFIKLLLSSDTR